MAEARTTIFEFLPAIAQLPGRCQGKSILLMKLDQLDEHSDEENPLYSAILFATPALYSVRYECAG